MSAYEGELDLEREKCILITCGKNWMEQAAKDQLCGVSRLPGIVKTVGLPDLHPGKIPVGMAALSEDGFYPHLIGNDIGCGMSLFATGVKRRKFKMDKWLARLNHIHNLSDIPFENPYGEDCPIQDFGTLGGGNHFAEFQSVEHIYDQETAESLGITQDQILLLIHCGSRGYGQQILSRYYVPTGLKEHSTEAQEYLRMHDNALMWAERNRRAVTGKLLGCLGVDNNAELLLDSCHNYLDRTERGWVHRKGSVSTKLGAVVIPGSRGSLTYVCVPRDDTEISLDSLSHGAGRKWARSICKSRIDKKYDRESIRSTDLKSRVICHDTNLLFAEAPEAYKNIEQVIDVLVEYQLIDVAVTLRPLITFKG